MSCQETLTTFPQIIVGDDYNLNIIVYTDKDNDTRKDITGWSFYLNILNKKTDADADAIATADGTITDAANGEALITIPDTVTDDLETGNYYAKIMRKNASGDKNTFLTGTIIIGWGEITRS